MTHLPREREGMTSLLPVELHEEPRRTSRGMRVAVPIGVRPHHKLQVIQVFWTQSSCEFQVVFLSNVRHEPDQFLVVRCSPLCYP